MKYVITCKGYTGYLGANWWEDILDDVWFGDTHFELFEAPPDQELLAKYCNGYNKYLASKNWIRPDMLVAVPVAIITQGELNDLLKDLPEGSMGRKIVQGLLNE